MSYREQELYPTAGLPNNEWLECAAPAVERPT
jgi:hypothetical protein